MNVFGVGIPEIAVIGAIALLIFGPKRLPEFGRTLGKTLKGLQSASSEFEKELQKAMAESSPAETEGEALQANSEGNKASEDKAGVSSEN